MGLVTPVMSGYRMLAARQGGAPLANHDNSKRRCWPSAGLGCRRGLAAVQAPQGAGPHRAAEELADQCPVRMVQGTDGGAGETGLDRRLAAPGAAGLGGDPQVAGITAFELGGDLGSYGEPALEDVGRVGGQGAPFAGE